MHFTKIPLARILSSYLETLQMEFFGLAFIPELHTHLFSDHICINDQQASQINILPSEFIVFPTPLSPWEFSPLLPSSSLPSPAHSIVANRSPASFILGLSLEPSPITAALMQGTSRIPVWGILVTSLWCPCLSCLQYDLSPSLPPARSS